MAAGKLILSGYINYNNVRNFISYLGILTLLADVLKTVFSITVLVLLEVLALLTKMKFKVSNSHI